jgi:hypothetical protein
MNTTLQAVDHAALKTNQAAIILLGLVAFLLNLPWLVVLVAAVMLAGTLLGKPGFGFLYRYLLKPAGLLKPDVVQDNPEPHRFAQGLGGVFLTASGLFLFSGLPVMGWALNWIVIALAALNFFVGFCAGCAVYYWFNRLGLPGFRKNPPAGAFPGKRPKASV